MFKKKDAPALVSTTTTAEIERKVGQELKKQGPARHATRIRTAETAALMYDMPRWYDYRKYDKDIPTDRETLNNLCMLYFLREPVVNRGIRLAVDFPLSQFRLTHEDPALEQFFNDIAEELDLYRYISDITYFYYIYGEAILFGIVDDVKHPTMFKEMDLLNPSWTEVISHKNFIGKDCELVYHFHKDPYLQQLCKNPKTDLEMMLANDIPSDIRANVIDSRPVRLSPLQATLFKRTGDPLSPRGQSAIYPALTALQYQDDLVQGQRAVIRRHLAPHEYYFVGSDEQPASQTEIDEVYNSLQTMWQGTNNAFVWHHAMRVQIEGANGKTLPLGPEYEWVEKQILYSLGIPKSFMAGENIAYANASVALEVVISNWLTYRQNLEYAITKAIFEPICKMQKIYRKKKSTPTSQYYIKFKPRAWVPEFQWDKQYLRRDEAKIQLLIQMAKEGFVPWKFVTDSINITSEQIFTGFKSDYESQQKLAKLREAYGVKTPAEGGGAGEGMPDVGGLPGGMGGGMGGGEDFFGSEGLSGVDMSNQMEGAGEGAGIGGGEFGIEGEVTESGGPIAETSGEAPGLPTAL